MAEPVEILYDSPAGARMAVVLATDAYETIRPVVRRLREQTVREQLELVIVGPAGRDLGLDPAELQGFGSVRVLRVESLRPFGAARAAGVRASQAPLVFIGETHTYPHPTWAETLIATHAEPWAAVVPGFGNANPNGVLSWSIFLLDYGPWLHSLPPGVTVMAPTHNVVYKREVLLGLGGALDRALTHGDLLLILFRERAHRTFFQPAARIDHLNVAQLAPWIDERFQSGLVVAGRRAQRWSPLKRLVYFCGSPLIPFVLLARMGPGVRQAYRQFDLPAGTLAALVAGTMISAFGEMIAYARGPVANADARMLEMELHKVRYASARRPARAAER